ncbi:hypothetical protein [Aquipuribacter hungaricus]|uniref:Signal transduction histidine kinase n=1 Tax=Aquipuribacter hungaricus TaxID=545624 RepID=A0ABV7WBJ6_9MICO
MSDRLEDTVVGRLPRSVVALGILGFVAVLGVLGLVSIDRVVEPGPYVAALVLALASVAAVLLPWPHGRERPTAVAVVAAVVATGLLVVGVLPEERPGYALWYPSFVWVPLSGLALRGHPVLAMAGALLSAGTTVAWTHLTPGVGFLDALDRVVSPTAVVVVAIGVAVLVRQYAGEVDRARAEQLQAARLSAGARAAETERRTRLAQIEQLAAPVLVLLRDAGTVDDRLATECRLLEAALRDGIRGRHLVDAAVRETLWAARTRGVTVRLLDDSGADEAGGSPPPVADVARRCIVEVVEKLENGEVTARLSGPDDATVVVITPDAGDVALACGPALRAQDRPGRGVRVRAVSEAEDELVVTVRQEPPRTS